MSPAHNHAATRGKVADARQNPTTDNAAIAWVQQQYTGTLIMLSVLIIIFHPAFHFILGLLPGIPPDSLRTRLVSVAVAIVLLGGVLLHPSLRRYSNWLQVINATVAI